MARGYRIQDFYQAATKYGLARNNAFRIKNISGDAAATINLHITTMVKKWDEFDTTNHTRVEQDTRIQYVLPSTE